MRSTKSAATARRAIASRVSSNVRHARLSWVGRLDCGSSPKIQAWRPTGPTLGSTSARNPCTEGHAPRQGRDLGAAPPAAAARTAAARTAARLAAVYLACLGRSLPRNRSSRLAASAWRQRAVLATGRSHSQAHILQSECVPTPIAVLEILRVSAADVDAHGCAHCRCQSGAFEYPNDMSRSERLTCSPRPATCRPEGQ